VKCLFGCGDYGLGACPPNTPSVGECESFFNEYNDGLIIRLTKFADKDSYPSDWSREVTNKLLEIENKHFYMGIKKFFYSTRPVVIYARIVPETALIARIKKVKAKSGKFCRRCL